MRETWVPVPMVYLQIIFQLLQSDLLILQMEVGHLLSPEKVTIYGSNRGHDLKKPGFCKQCFTILKKTGSILMYSI